MGGFVSPFAEEMGVIMNEETFQRTLAELIAEIGTLPQEDEGARRMEELVTRTRERHQALVATVNQLQESIDFVRLCIKYMQFDLEATRRENKQLREALEQMGGQGEEMT